MKFYFAGSETMALTYHTDFGIQNFLTSFGWFTISHFKRWCNETGFKINQKGEKKLFLDCGAFSVQMGTISTRLSQYVDFIQRFGKTFDYIASMDVVGNPESTFNNYKDMDSLGIDSIPTFHLGESFDWFDKYCKMTDYVAVGGIAGAGNSTTKSIHPFLEKIFERKPKDIKIHVFGMAIPIILKKFGHLIESVDTTNWLQGQKYSLMSKRDGKNFSFYDNLKGHLSAKQKKELLSYNVRRYQELENDINSYPVLENK